MDAAVAMLVDAGFEWPAIASGALVVIFGGLVVYFIQRRIAKDDDEEKAEKTGLKTQLQQFGLQLATEREERRDDLSREANARREKDDSLGRDIGAIRQEIAYQAGQKGRDRPKFGRDD